MFYKIRNSKTYRYIYSKYVELEFIDHSKIEEAMMITAGLYGLFTLGLFFKSPVSALFSILTVTIVAIYLENKIDESQIPSSYFPSFEEWLQVNKDPFNMISIEEYKLMYNDYYREYVEGLSINQDNDIQLELSAAEEYKNKYTNYMNESEQIEEELKTEDLYITPTQTK